MSAKPQRQTVQETHPIPAGGAGKEETQPVGAMLTVIAGLDLGQRALVSGSASIGRDPESDLYLADPKTSWEHARIEQCEERWKLCDCGSTNGTLLNGEKVGEATLRGGDKIRIGGTILRFELQDDVDRAYSDAISRMIHIDELSGLYLPRRFDLELRALLDRAGVGESEVGLLVMDLDGIKQINDRWGHPFGAFTISEAGAVIGARIQDSGFACRWGGDEYVAALPGKGIEEAMAFAETLLAAIQNHPFEKDGVSLRPGISIGAAAFPEDAASAEELFAAADQALYRAKQAGKGCVRR